MSLMQGLNLFFTKLHLFCAVVITMLTAACASTNMTSDEPQDLSPGSELICTVDHSLHFKSYMNKEPSIPDGTEYLLSFSAYQSKEKVDHEKLNARGFAISNVYLSKVLVNGQHMFKKCEDFMFVVKDEKFVKKVFALTQETEFSKYLNFDYGSCHTLDQGTSFLLDGGSQGYVMDTGNGLQPLNIIGMHCSPK